MQQKNAKELFKKYQQGNATQSEKDLIGDWVLFGKLKELDLTEEEIEQELSLIDKILPLYPGKKARLWPRLAAAASIVICLSAGGFLLLHYLKPAQQITKNQTNDIGPGGNKAILTLANGSKIILNDFKNGVLANQGNAKVIKLANGQIAYNKTKTATSQVLFNTMTTPRGGKYDLTLADGTKVWLNSESSITYPVTFTGNHREVTITGEAYFEVTKNKHLPFRVKSGDQTVEVLGTHFNINSYTDEASIKTTLLEGSVKVSSAKTSSIIKPGEQAEFMNGGIKVYNVDTEGAVAWKNGFFHYNRADIKTIMRSFARWYDVEIEYDGKVPDKKFSGDIHQDLTASKALKVLSYLNINFTIQNKKIIVTNKI